jgi:hypothetical protein
VTTRHIWKPMITIRQAKAASKPTLVCLDATLKTPSSVYTISSEDWKHLGTYLSHQRHQSATTGDLQLAEDGMKMFFHRFETQAAFVGNLLIAAPIAH